MREKTKGGLSVSNNVIADLAGYAASECYGIVGMIDANAAEGLINLLPANKLKRGIVIANEDGKLVIDLYIVVEYGVNISVVSANLQERVAYVLSTIAQIVPHEINVHVKGLKVHS